MAIFRSFFWRCNSSGRFLACAGAVIFGLAGESAVASEPVLVQGPQGAITTQDILSDAVRIPDEMRSTVLGSAKTVQQIATNLYVRRALGEEASKLGLANDVEVKAALQVAKDKVLSDAYLAQLDKQNTPSRDVAENMARNIYRAKPQDFKAAEQVQVRHILIATQGDAGRAEAKKLLQELKAGADFAAMARTHSADTASATKGGDLGFFSEGRMAPEFEAAAFALKNPGELSDVVQTQFGFHVLQLEARKPAGQQSFEEVREALIQKVMQDAAQSARVAAADKFRAQAHAELPAIEAFSASMKSSTKP